MAEEKAFDATASRLARARREGDVPRASELVAWASFAGGAATALAMAAPLAGSARALFEASAAGRVAPAPLVRLTLAALAPLAAAGFAACVTTLAVAGGPHVAFPRLQMAKLAPSAGLRRMLSREAALAAARALLAAGAAGLAAAGILREAAGAVLGARGLSALAAVGSSAVRRILAAVLAVALAFALVDALLERTRRRRRLRMSFDELKRDHKQNEGDPVQRGRRRAAHRALVRGSLARIAEAAFVVVNPMHVAIALEYKPPRVPIPRVLIRAVDAGARIVKAQARELRIPVIEHPVLARRLLETCEVGMFVPPECYDATARIVAALVAAKALE